MIMTDANGRIGMQGVVNGRATLAGMTLALLLGCGGAAQAADFIADATFACADGKSIYAIFYADSVDITLGDGRTMSLPQTMSGSGARYANSSETVVFWNKGNTAFITEGADDNMTYADCVTDGQ
jgi:membrane-bound inhibitor of C-type lysozyme